jgi:hypothetical protein
MFSLSAIRPRLRTAAASAARINAPTIATTPDVNNAAPATSSTGTA